MTGVSDRVPLVASGVRAGYGAVEVLREVSFACPDGVTAVVGRNGAGKSTLLHVLMGLTRRTAGDVQLFGSSVPISQSAHRVARRGVALVPQGRRLFPTLTAVENLRLGPARTPTMWPLERVFDLLPEIKALQARRAAYLSGGEQQMVAIGRALMRNPRLLLLDEPTEGLAPSVVDRVRALLADVHQEGVPCLLVEQNLAFAAALADRILVLARGVISATYERGDFSTDADWRDRVAREVQAS